ncbi:IS5 family transposase [Cerasicoccus maritimus]|uniref:IS5 family transposase n=1 Tax=Cerasicoccus maritimus TaxID=490089 RepID=UPI0028528EDC|nr:IS5 family transposase [Cerasicoccus maritimus]
MHLMVDALGYPVHFIITGGESADCTQAHALLKQCEQAVQDVIAEKGYDSNTVREGVMQQADEAIIPSKSNRKETIPHDKLLYAARHLVENTIGKLIHNRRLATRYDKTVSSFAAFVNLACIKMHLVN